MKRRKNIKFVGSKMVTPFGVFNFVYNKELDAYHDVVLFPEKVEMAKKVIAESGVPPRKPIQDEKRKR
jgi:hypothetical protein